LPRVTATPRKLLAKSAELRSLLGVSVGSVPGFALPFALTLRLTAGHLTDAYFYAFALALLPSTLLSVVLETNVLPAAEDHKRKGALSLARFVRRLVAQSLAIGVLVYSAIALIGLLVIQSKTNWPSSEKRLCSELVLVFAPYVIAISASSVYAGCLHALGDFFTTTSTQGIRSLLPLALIFAVPRTATGVLIAAAALAVGESIRVLLLRHRLRQHSQALESDSSASARARTVWDVALPHGLALLAALANPTIDRIVASSLATGSVTLLDLAEKVLYAPLVALNASIVLVAGARWARYDSHAVDELTADVARTLRRTIVVSLGVSIVVLGVVLAASQFGPARISGIDVAEFTGVLAILLAGLPAATVVTTMLRFLTVTRYTVWLPVVSVITVVINASGDIVGAKLVGIYGIVIASTVIRYVDATLLSLLSARRVRSLRDEAGNAAS
jgi:putative peptidoglycan lipid II flippase